MPGALDLSMRRPVDALHLLLHRSYAFLRGIAGSEIAECRAWRLQCTRGAGLRDRAQMMRWRAP